MSEVKFPKPDKNSKQKGEPTNLLESQSLVLIRGLSSLSIPREEWDWIEISEAYQLLGG